MEGKSNSVHPLIFDSILSFASMDFLSKFTKPADHSKPASEGKDPNSTTTEPSSTDLLSSAKVVSGAAQSYFSHQPATYENTELAGATADILDAASKYGKLDKTQGAGKYVDQAENYLKEYKASNTTPAATNSTAADAGVKASLTTEAAETDTAAIKGADASTEKSTKPESYTTEGLSSKPPSVDAPVEADASDVYGEDKSDGLPKKASGGGAAAETYSDTHTQASGGGATRKTDVSDDYQQPKVDKYEESTEEDFTKKPAAAATDASEDYAKDTEDQGISVKPSIGGAATGTRSGDSGYAEDTEEGLPKPSAGGYAAGDDAREKASHAEGGFGNFTKVAGGFFNK